MLTCVANYCVWFVLGTKDGMLLCMSLDKPTFTSPWSAASERANEDDDVCDGSGDEPVSLRKLHWMAPQPPSLEGCLFMLIGTPGRDNESVKSVLVGLSPVKGPSDLEVVFSLPSIPLEKTLSFCLVPSYIKSEVQFALLDGRNREEDEDANGDEEANAEEAALRAMCTPALLLLTQRYNGDDDEDSDDDDSDTRLKVGARGVKIAVPGKLTSLLKIVRCPDMDMANWALEVGTLPDPRPATEVYPGTSKITVRHASVACTNCISFSFMVCI
jgi:hypothetical protein